MLSPQEAIQLDGQILFSLLHKVSPVAYKHLSKQKIDPILYMTEWFMCAFSRTLPWSSVLRVWDMFFCEGRGLLLEAAAWASLRGWLAAPLAQGRHLGLCQEEWSRSLWGGGYQEVSGEPEGMFVSVLVQTKFVVGSVCPKCQRLSSCVP